MSLEETFNRMLSVSPRVDLRLFRDRKGSLSVSVQGWKKADKSSAIGTVFSGELAGSLRDPSSVYSQMASLVGEEIPTTPFVKKRHSLEVEDDYWVYKAKDQDTFLIPVTRATIPREKYDPPGDNPTWKVPVVTDAPLYSPVWKVLEKLDRMDRNRVCLKVKGWPDTVGREASIEVPVSIRDVPYLSDELQITVGKVEQMLLEFKEITLFYQGRCPQYEGVVQPLPYNIGSWYDHRMLAKYPLFFQVKR